MGEIPLFPFSSLTCRSSLFSLPSLPFSPAPPSLVLLLSCTGKGKG